MPTGIGSGIAGEVFTDEIGSGSRGGSTICPTRYSVEFNGSSQWGSEEDTKIDLGTDNFSFSFWFKTIGGGTKQGFHTTRLGSGANGLDIYLSAAGQLTADFDTISFVGSTVPSDNEWHHAVLSVDRLGDWKWYLDGVNTDTTDYSAVTASIENGGTSAWARTTNSPVDYFDGNLTELSIWGTALSSSEVLTIYNNMFGSQTCLTDLTFSSGNLIQNGSFNEIGPQLIDNPTFNAPTSPDLIVNGDFSELGADVIYNGGFDTSIALGTTGSGWVNPDAAAAYNLGGCKITRGVSGFARLRGADILGNDDIISLSKSYKITYTVVENNGAASVIFDLAGTFSNDIPLSLTTHTVYVTSGTSATQRFQVYNQTASSNITLTDIVVKELGADWTLQDEWSIGEDKATYDATANAKNIKQLLNFELGKSYKIKFTTSTGTAKLKFTDQSGTQLFTDIAIANYAPNSYELYGTAIASTELRIYAYNSGGAEAFSITNISVQEVDWAFGGGWSLGSNKALATAAAGGDTLYQTGVFTLDKSYKTTFLSTLDSGNCFAEFGSDGFIGQLPSGTASNLFYYQTNEVGDSARIAFEVQSPMTGSISNVLTYQMDPNGYWNIPTANSTQLVLNPTFTNTGPEEVTNGDFSQTALGSELVTNGDFAVSGTLTSTSWSLGWSSGDPGSSISGGALNLVNNGGAFVGRAYATNGVDSIYVLEVGKTYSLTYEVTENLDAATLYYYAGSYVSISKDVGVHTVEFTASLNYFILRNGSLNTTIKIDNVSVKEVLQLVSNGDFTETGIELVDNNDFSNGTTDWTEEGSSSISVGTHEGRSDVADINITGTGAANRIEQPFTYVANKSYKVTVDVYVVSGSFRIDSRDAFVSGDFLSTSTTGSWQTLTGYITAIQSGTDVIWLRSMLDGGIGEISQFYVDSVSVKELGVDWTVIDNTAGDTVTFGGSSATWTKTDPEAVYLQQDYPVTLGASHKLTYTVLSNTYTGGGTELGLSSLSAYGQSPIPSSVGTHTVYLIVTLDTPAAALRFYSNDTGGSLEITDVSVQELGEGWSVTMSDGSATTATKYVEFVETGARLVSDNTNSPYIALKQSTLSTGKLYKLICNVAYTDTGTIRANIGGYNSPSLVEGLNTIYTPSISGTNGLIFLRNDNNVDCIISNVSVEETGLDWISPDAGVVNTFSATGLTMTSVNGAGDNTIQQVGVTADDQAYKVDYTIEGSSLNAGNYLQFYNGATYVNMKTTVGSHILHFTRSGADDSVFLKLASNDGSLTDTVDIESITIVEVQGWTLEDGKLVGDLPDLAKSATQDIGAIAGNSYKATMDVAIAEEELVTNGSFRQVGTNVVDCGDFSCAVPTDYWTFGTGWSVGDSEANCDGSSGNLIQSITGSTNKSFKLVFTISNFVSGVVTPTFVGITGTTYNANGTYTEYIQSGSDVRFVFYSTLFDGSITNVSVQEVGQDWTLTGGSQITEQGGRIYSSSGGVSSLDQSSVMDIGKSYKLTFDVIATNGGKLSNPNSSNIYDTSTVGSKVFYITAYYQTLYFKRFAGITDVTITNVSVEEVGELKVDIGGAPVQSITTSGTHSLTFTAVDSDPFRIYGSTFTGSVTNIFVTQVAGGTLERWWRVNGNIATLTDPAPNVASNGILNDLNWNNNPPVEPDTP